MNLETSREKRCVRDRQKTQKKEIPLRQFVLIALECNKRVTHTRNLKEQFTQIDVELFEFQQWKNYVRNEKLHH